MSAFEFTDTLPPGIRPGRKPCPVLADFAQGLRARPGKWARWPFPLAPTSAHCLNSRIRRGLYVSFAADEFEARTRSRVAYVRYSGPSASTVEARA
jgi:hypothetical protein